MNRPASTSTETPASAGSVPPRMGPVLARARASESAREETAQQRELPRWLRAVLGVPLLAKIAGANALIVIIAIVISLGLHDLNRPGITLASVMMVALVLSLLVNLLLVQVALRPIRDLENTAHRVWGGDLEARVPPSLVADRDMVRVGRTVNLLLDALTSDRARMRRLASLVITAQDEERSRIARELHDSTAQSLTAIVLQLSAAARDARVPEIAARLSEVKEMAGMALEEVRTLSHRVHPRVLDDLGLVAAVRWLARQARDSSDVDITVDALGETDRIPAQVASVLYRVAQEALTNAVRHAAPTTVAIVVRADANTATLEVSDDGRGFDIAEAEARRPGMGLFSMRERVSLVDGQLDLTSLPGSGTRVVARIPLTAGRPFYHMEANDG
ncbi:MAG TPA: sensor histidine kinase [Gemmatimonadaceae bacterium]|nr:sensor histidine kinase [Gemmatimonadaceae bacterium]